MRASEILDNAIASIVLGVEDFETGSEKRMLSAARNYHAGLPLLAKECLVRAAPNADAMDIIGAKFKPVPDGLEEIEYEVDGYATVGFEQLGKRFKSLSHFLQYFETWFRTLKFGTRIKDRRLDDTEGLRECLAFDTVTAVHMADLTVLARGRPETPVT